MFIVRAIAGKRVSYWDGSWWAADPGAAARFRDHETAHEAAVDADRAGGLPDDMPGTAQVEIVQVT